MADKGEPLGYVDAQGTEQSKLFADLQLMIAGRKLATAWGAVSDLLAAIIGFASDTQEEAFMLVDKVAGDLKGTIKKNWPETRGARERANFPKGQA